MRNKVIRDGLLLGGVTGLAATAVDSLYIFIAHSYATYEYALLQIVFNLCWWSIIGVLSGLCIHRSVGERQDYPERKDVYWAIYFVVPFAVLYGLLGRTYVHVSPWSVNYGAPVFDRHLSFLWVAVVLFFIIRAMRLKKQGQPFCTSFFLPETLTIMVLYNLCSNLRLLGGTASYVRLKKLFLVNISETTWNIIVYCVFVAVTLFFYLVVSSRVRLALQRLRPVKGWQAAAVIGCIVFTCSTLFVFLNQSRITRAEATDTGLSPGPPPVIVIVLDTVRADRLAVYGNKGVGMHLEKFARDAVVFENCIASSSWTTPSHASLFTGLYPREHGSHGVLDFDNKDPFGFPHSRRLDDRFKTLAEIFLHNGYATAGICSNSMVFSPNLNFSQGFETIHASRSIGELYETYPFSPIVHLFCNLTNICNRYVLFYRTADAITRESLKTIQTLENQSFFLFMNYLDAHGPYFPPRPFNGMFLDKPFPHLYRLGLILKTMTGRLKKEERDTYQISQYDGEITFIDSQLAAFFRQLKAMNLYDPALIVVTSDHGELFGEHDIYWHRSPMYQGAVRVPLLIKYPFSEKTGRVDLPITLSDLYATVITLCKLPVPDYVSGKAFGTASGPIAAEYYDYTLGEHQVLYDGTFKLLRYSTERPTELYDLASDPGELINLAEKMPEKVKEMEAKRLQWQKNHPPHYMISEKPEKTIPYETLRALGYIK